MTRSSRILCTVLVGLSAGWTRLSAADAPPAWTVRGHVPPDQFLVQSHRGAGELEAENCVEAFELAWKLGTVPEADVRATRDGVTVAFHDADFKRLVKDAPPGLTGKGVKDLPWDEVRGLDVGSWKGAAFAGRRVPRMADVFRLMAGRPDRRLYLDIKEVDLKRLAAEVRAAKVEAQVILASTHHPVIKEWKGLVPESGTLLWMGGGEAALAERLADLRKTGFEGVTQLQIHVRPKAGTDEFTPSPAFLSKAGQELRDRGILFQTLPWGSTDERLYRRLLDLGAASFATDHPRVTLDAVRRYYGQGKAVARP